MRTKSVRYTAAQDESLLIQSGKDFFQNCKGKWTQEYFKNNNPIVLELACGRGEYTIGFSQIFPEKNFIGVDVKGERMMLGVKSYQYRMRMKSVGGNQKNSGPFTANSSFCNVSFLRTIIHHIDQFFAPGEVDEIWMIHPDPRPKGHDTRRRITSPRFIHMYENILKSGGLLRLKTDDDGLFEYSLEQITAMSGFELLASTRDLHNSELLSDHHGIRTYYEQEALDAGKTIKYAIFQKK